MTNDPDDTNEKLGPHRRMTSNGHCTIRISIKQRVQDNKDERRPINGDKCKLYLQTNAPCCDARRRRDIPNVFIKNYYSVLQKGEESSQAARWPYVGYVIKPLTEAASQNCPIMRLDDPKRSEGQHGTKSMFIPPLSEMTQNYKKLRSLIKAFKMTKISCRQVNVRNDVKLLNCACIRKRP